MTLLVGDVVGDAESGERYGRVSGLLEGVRLLPAGALDAEAHAMGWVGGLRRPGRWSEALEGGVAGRLLGFVSEEMAAQYLARFGVLGAVARAASLPEDDVLRVEILGGVGQAQTLRVWSTFWQDSPLVELILRPEYILPLGNGGEPRGGGFGWPSLYMERLVLERPPSDRFSRKSQHWPWPGQRRPGLGLCEEVLEVVLRWATQLGVSAVTQIPEHFHGGVVFSRAFSYVGPKMRGWLASACERLLGRALPGASRLATDNPRCVARRRLRLARTTWAFEWGLVRDQHGRRLLWPTEMQARLLDPALRLLDETTIPGPRFRIDRRAFEARWRALLDRACPS